MQLIEVILQGVFIFVVFAELEKEKHELFISVVATNILKVVKKRVYSLRMPLPY
jgi:hypothetical protein